MDIFNRKKVAELEERLEQTKRSLVIVKKERDDIQRDLVRSSDTLKAIQAMQDAIPEDCTPGEYCRACEFVKPYFFCECHSVITGYTCAKGQSCKNFVQNEV